MMRTVALVAGLVVTAAGLTAQTISVDYVAGQVQTLQGGRWEALSAGSLVDPDATLRLGREAVIDLSFEGARVTLAAPGSYAVRDVLAQQVSARRDFGAFLGSALRGLLAPPQERGGPLGSRSGVDSKPMEWADEEKMVLDQARRLLNQGSSREARDLLLDKREPGGDNRAFDFLIACSAALEGRTGPALSVLRAIAIDDSMGFGAEALALHAQLAFEAGSHAEAAAAAGRCLADYPSGAPAQGCLLIAGLALRALGRNDEGRAALERAVADGPDTDAGRLAARELLR